MGNPQKHTLGKRGEELVRRFLQDKGYTIIATNYRYGHGEIDIIARAPQEELIVFTEVKSYYARPLGPPELRVTKKQQKTIIRTAYAYLDEHPEYGDFLVRYDIVTVNFSKYPAEISQYEAAFWQDEAFLF